MNTRNKGLLMAAIATVGIYALAPFVAGLLNSYDRRGPKIFFRGHHELLYVVGYYLAGHHHHDGKPRVPFLRERAWFYGMNGKPIPRPAWMDSQLK